MFEINIYPKNKDVLCRKTVNIDLELLSEFLPFIKKMQDYVLNTEHVIGLAANQVWNLDGYNCPKIFVMAISEEPGTRVFINPTVHFSGPSVKHIEGCVSRPGKQFLVKRSKNVTIHYFNIDGKEVIEKYGGTYAQIIGHEMQHLEGGILKREFKT